MFNRMTHGKIFNCTCMIVFEIPHIQIDATTYEKGKEEDAEQCPTIQMRGAMLQQFKIHLLLPSLNQVALVVTPPAQGDLMLLERRKSEKLPAKQTTNHP